VNIKGWDTLDSFDPEYHERAPQFNMTREEKELSFTEFNAPEPNAEEYLLLVQAAKSAGVIKTSFPYEPESSIVKKAKPMLSSDAAATFPNMFYTYVFDDAISMGNLPYDRRFCQLLRAGIDDAYAMLLFAILPNVDDVFLRGVQSDPTALEWPTPNHGFKALRRLRAAGVDCQLAWGIGYMNTLLSQTRNLTELLLHNVASWHKGKNDDLELEERARPVVLQPRSLNVTNLQMCCCALNKVDMGNLIRACPKLTSFQYYTGSDETGPYNFGIMDLMEILDPLKHTLEELALDIVPYWTDDFDEPRIVSLSHFTALRRLDTTPAMWEHMVDADFDLYGDTMEEEHRLSRRLPRSLTRLIFHASEESIESDEELLFPAQIVDLIENYADWVPNLKMVFFGVKLEESAAEIADVLEQVALEHRDVYIEIGKGNDAYGPTRTFMDAESRSGSLPVTKWFAQDGKYAARHEKKLGYAEAVSRLCDKPENQGLTEYEMSELIHQDATVNEALEQIKLNGFPEPEYESEDAEEEED
tara:strand:- start:1302 stop:2891 length:1590 start_codon:yes stop_codon:yes gene_type:complete